MCWGERKDGFEVISRAVIALPILNMVMGCPGAVVALQYDLPVFRFFNLHHLALNVLLVLFVCSNLCVDWTFVVTLGLTVLIYVNYTAKWIIRSQQAW